MISRACPGGYTSATDIFPTTSAAEKPVTRSAPLFQRRMRPRRSAATMPSTVASMSRSRKSFVLRSSASMARGSVTSRKLRIARPCCDRIGPADTLNTSRRPSRVWISRSADKTRPPRCSSRQTSAAFIALCGATSSVQGSPRACSMVTPSVAQPAGLRLSTLPSSSSTAMPSETWLKNSS